VLISGSLKWFSAWQIDKDVNYYYDVVDENGNSVPLNDINTLKIVPYTFNKINTNTTSVSEDGRIDYIIEDKIITVNLK